MINIINFFTGIGWFELALNRLNIPFNVKVYSEEDKYCDHIYKMFNGNNIHLENPMEHKPVSYPPHDVLFYSTTFLDVGGIKRENNERYKGRDTKYLYHILDIINLKKPKYIVSDNSYFLHSKKRKSDLEAYIEYINQMGYRTKTKIVDALDYGLPMRKQRTAIVSIRDDIDQEFEFPEPDIDVNIFNWLEDDVDYKYYHSGIYKSIITDYPMLVWGSGDKFIVTRERKKYATGLSYNYAKGLDKTRNRTYIADSKGTRKLVPKEFAKLYGLSEKEFIEIESHFRNNFHYRGYDVTDSRMYSVIGKGIALNPYVYILNELLGHLRQM